MKRLLACLALLPVLVGATACGDRADGGGIEGNTADGPGVRVTVHTATRPAPDGEAYTEGFRPEIRLVAADGAVRAPVDDHTGTAVFEDVAPGRYTLRAAVRTCEGSCDHLDQPGEVCRRPMVIRDALTARVVFVVSLPCRIQLPPENRTTPPPARPTEPCKHPLRTHETDNGVDAHEPPSPCPTTRPTLIPPDTPLKSPIGDR